MPVAASETPTPASAASEPLTDEDAEFDLSDLEQKGVEGIVAGAEPGDDDPGAPPHRPVWISFLVLALAFPLLVRMYPDFRYWLRGDAPEDLGRAETFVTEGRVPSGYLDRYVKLAGTPDVRNVAVGKSRTETVRYLRFMESQGQLLAVIRTPKSEETPGQTVRYPGQFEGRMTRLGDLGRTSWVLWSEPEQYKWLAQFYEVEDVARTIDASPKALTEALRQADPEALILETDEGPVALSEADRVRLVVEHPDARVLLGSNSFPAEAAEAAMTSLGIPFAKVESRDTTRHRFVARIPKDDIPRIREVLEARLDVGLDGADPRQGVAVLPMTSTFLVRPNELELRDGMLVFPRGENTSTAGYEVEGAALRERANDDAFLRFDPAQLGAVRIEKAIRLDPDGYVILNGETPADQRMFGVLWIFTVLVSAANVVAIAFGLRSRRRTPGTRPSTVR